ncbi:hypothetical protein ACX80Z_13780 [Arthrobacter sp. TMT4-20]
MKVRWIQNEQTAQFGFTSVADELDGSPRVKSLLFDLQPLVVNPDRLAVAAALIFSRHASRSLEFEIPVNHFVAEGVLRYTDPEGVWLSPVHFEAPEQPRGSNRLRLKSFINVDGQHIIGGLARDEAELVLTRSDLYNGSLVGVKRKIVASNAWLFVAAKASGIEVHLPEIAAGVLFCDDFMASELVIHTAEPRHEFNSRPVEMLLSRVGISLSVVFGGDKRPAL